jgi:hypothetical protein
MSNTGDENHSKSETTTWNAIHFYAVRRSISTFSKAKFTLTFRSIDDGQYVTSPVRLGSRADSFYEYLLCVLVPH